MSFYPFIVMKQSVLLITFLFLFSIYGYSQSNTQPLIYGELLQFEVRWSGPVSGSLPIHRSPIAYPSVSIDDYILYFYDIDTYFTIQIINDKGELVYTVSKYPDSTTLILPSELSGNFELRIYYGSNYYFYCDVFL